MKCVLLNWILGQKIHQQTSQWYSQNVCKLGDTVNISLTELSAYENNLWKQFKYTSAGTQLALHAELPLALTPSNIQNRVVALPTVAAPRRLRQDQMFKISGVWGFERWLRGSSPRQKPFFRFPKTKAGPKCLYTQSKGPSHRLSACQAGYQLNQFHSPRDSLKPPFIDFSLILSLKQGRNWNEPEKVNHLKLLQM